MGTNPFSDIKVIISIVTAALVAAALVIGLQTVSSWKEGFDQNKVKTETLKATSGIIQDGSKADEERTTVDQSVGEARGQFQQDYQGAMRHEPETAARADAVLRDGVRNAFRARRLARERSGCSGEQCGERSQASTAAER